MEIDKDLELADEWAEYVSPWAKEGWRATCKRLANEVRRLRAELADAAHDRDEHRRVAKLLGEELAALRQQEPAGVFFQNPHDGLWYPQIADHPDETVTPLYAASGAQPAVSVPRFPTMLRKMWSGHEVQEWLDANIQHVVSVPTIEAAERMGAKGGPVVEAERLAFEAWMRGHCWALCATWDGKTYRSDSEQGGRVCPSAMNTRQMWAAWRDRAALSAGQEGRL